jgi:hypothetical protein
MTKQIKQAVQLNFLFFYQKYVLVSYMIHLWSSRHSLLVAAILPLHKFISIKA